MGLILLWFIIGVLCFITYDDPSKPTLEDFKDDICCFKGATAPIFIVLYIILYIFAILLMPFLIFIESFEVI